MAKDFNSQQVVETYDDHIRKLIPGYELVHAQVRAILETVYTQHAHILIVGCGTGYELRWLLELHPEWRYTAIDPSIKMLEKARKLIAEIPGADNVSFIHGDTSVLKTLQTAAEIPEVYSAALVLLVSHFVPFAEKQHFFKDIYDSLEVGGLMLNYDLMQPVSELDLTILQTFCVNNGLSQVQSEKMLARLNSDFFMLSDDAFTALLQSSGFEQIQTFCQSLMYTGFLAKK